MSKNAFLLIKQALVEKFFLASDLEDIGIPKSKIETIVVNLSHLRPTKFTNLSTEHEALFDAYSTHFTPDEARSIRTDCIKQVGYLTGVVQHVKRQIRGFNGQAGVLEGVTDQFSKCPEDILLDEIDTIQNTIRSLQSSLD